MSTVEDRYFEWLIYQIDPEGATEGVVYLCGLLHECEFHRRVGNDINRAVNGANLRKEFLEEFQNRRFAIDSVNDLLAMECTWLEMLIALARALDFLYDGGVDGRFAEMIINMNLGHVAVYNPNRSRTVREFDRQMVTHITNAINGNNIDRDGHGGLFPLQKRNHVDQREVEIWSQHSAYFSEKLEGVLWTSTK